MICEITDSLRSWRFVLVGIVPVVLLVLAFGSGDVFANLGPAERVLDQSANHIGINQSDGMLAITPITYKVRDDLTPTYRYIGYWGWEPLNADQQAALHTKATQRWTRHEFLLNSEPLAASMGYDMNVVFIPIPEIARGHSLFYWIVKRGSCYFGLFYCTPVVSKPIPIPLNSVPASYAP